MTLQEDLKTACEHLLEATEKMTGTLGAAAEAAPLAHGWLARVILTANQFGIYVDTAEKCPFQEGDRVRVFGAGPYLVCGKPQQQGVISWLVPHVFPPDDPSADAVRHAHRTLSLRGETHAESYLGLPIYWAPSREVAHWIATAVRPLSRERLRLVATDLAASADEVREMAVELLTKRATRPLLMDALESVRLLRSRDPDSGTLRRLQETLEKYASGARVE